jgi:hypothetical protein
LKRKAVMEEREVRADTIACALKGYGESGVRVRVRADMAGRYLPHNWTQPEERQL